MAAPIKDETGKRFGRLVVLKKSGVVKSRETAWLCLCDCGNEKVVNGVYLRSGVTKSCGCFRSENSSAMNSTHNMSKTMVYMTWAQMKARCFNDKSPGFNDYGGRGIVVCDRWMKFENFFADMGEPPEGMSIDRIDVNGNYEPDNCRWATDSQQNRNRRNSVYVEWEGSKLHIAEVAERLGIPRRAALLRYKRGTLYAKNN